MSFYCCGDGMLRRRSDVRESQIPSSDRPSSSSAAPPVEWEPYKILGIVDNSFWRVRVPLIHFYIVEFHYPDRVVRQFGMRQGKPSACQPDDKALHKLKGSGQRGHQDWGQKHAKYVTLWNMAERFIFQGDLHSGRNKVTADYMEWYLRSTLRFVVPPLLDRSGFYSQVADNAIRVDLLEETRRQVAPERPDLADLISRGMVASFTVPGHPTYIPPPSPPEEAAPTQEPCRRSTSRRPRTSQPTDPPRRSTSCPNPDHPSSSHHTNPRRRSSSHHPPEPDHRSSSHHHEEPDRRSSSYHPEEPNPHDTTLLDDYDLVLNSNFLYGGPSSSYLDLLGDTPSYGVGSGFEGGGGGSFSGPTMVLVNLIWNWGCERRTRKHSMGAKKKELIHREELLHRQGVEGTWHLFIEDLLYYVDI